LDFSAWKLKKLKLQTGMYDLGIGLFSVVVFDF
jgi:hypothetical protein